MSDAPQSVSTEHEEQRLLRLWFEQQIENAQQDQISGFAGGSAAGNLRGERAHARHCALYEAQQMVLAALPQPVGVAQAGTDRGELLRGLAAFFDESVHHVWSNDEIAACLTDMISEPQPTQGDKSEAAAWQAHGDRAKEVELKAREAAEAWIWKDGKPTQGGDKGEAVAFVPLTEGGRPQWAETFGADDGCYIDYPEKWKPLYAAPQPVTAAYTAKEPTAWCQPMDCGKHTPRKFYLYFDDPDHGNMVFDNETEARDAFTRKSTAWNCYLFGALPLSSTDREGK